MLAPHTRRIFLSPITKDDYNLLWRWRNDKVFILNCTKKKDEISFNDFVKELDYDFRVDRHEQYIVCKKTTSVPIGTIFSYNFSEYDKHLFITLYLEKEFTNFGYGVDAFLLLSCYVMEEYDLFKIYTDVYAHNVKSLKPLLKGGFREEGRFIGHRFVDGKRVDILRLAMYQSDLPRAKELAQSLGSESVK